MKVCTTCSKEWPDDTKFCPDDGSTLRSAAGNADMIGSVIADRYHVTKKLGEGGMGAVYLGEHVKMGRKSAIKVMVSSMANDPDAVARFNREAANAARINHHNVCGIYDFGETSDGVIFLAMEFIEGEALTDLLEREGALPPARAADILKQCTDALQAAHDLGIVHRDIKPDNIMVAKTRDGRDLIKVVDFGIAKAVGGEEGQNVTKTGLVVGTPEYMSPEQLSGDVLDGRSDVYSIALVYYRMLTGTLPFQADTAQETMIKRLTDEPMPLAQAYPAGGFDAQLQQVLDRSLQRIPKDRYSTAQEFGADVLATLGGAPTGAAAPAYDDGATQLIDSAEVSALGDDATAEIAATRVASQAERSPTPDTAQPVAVPVAEKKKKPAMAIAAAVIIVAVGGGTAAKMMMGGGEEPTPQPIAAAAGTTAIDTAGAIGAPTEPAQQQGNGTARNGSDTAARNPSNNDRPARDTTTTVPQQNDPPPAVEPAVDVAAIVADLNRLQDRADGGGAMAPIVTELQAIYDMERIPDSLRVRAALVAAVNFEFLGQNEDACTWYQNVINVEPSRATGLAQALGTLGCSSN